MALTVSPRHAADEEAQAEVEVLNSRLEKTSQLTKKIQASLTRLETSGRSVQEAIGPIYNNTQKLQVLGRSRHTHMIRLHDVNIPLTRYRRHYRGDREDQATI